MSTPKSLVWFITGTSSGFGAQLVRSALTRGDKVIATSRASSFARLPASLGLESFSEEKRANCKFVELDVTDTEENIEKAAAQAVGLWGRVDVVVNNAGVALGATLEEGGVEALEKQFATNLYGPVKVTNAFLPHMRGNKSGTIVFFGSRSGWITDYPIRGIYGSSKAALHALADTYSVELAQFNVNVLCLVPGAFKTSAMAAANAAHSSTSSGPPRASPFKTIPEYSELKKKAMANVPGHSGNADEAGDPVKLAEILLDLVRGDGVAKGRKWSDVMFLGPDCIQEVRGRLDMVRKVMDEWEDVGKSTNFD